MKPTHTILLTLNGSIIIDFNAVLVEKDDCHCSYVRLDSLGGLDPTKGIFVFDFGSCLYSFRYDCFCTVLHIEDSVTEPDLTTTYKASNTSFPEAILQIKPL